MKIFFYHHEEISKEIQEKTKIIKLKAQVRDAKTKEREREVKKKKKRISPSQPFSVLAAPDANPSHSPSRRP